MQTRSFSMAVAALQRQLRNHATLHIMASDRTVRLLVVVTALLFLPLDFTQLAFAVTGACIYTFIQHASEHEDWWPMSSKKSKGKGARKAPRSMKAWPPRLPGVCWEADVQLLLAQITPGAEAERAVARIVETVREAIRPLFPESDVCGFVSGELEGSRAFRVAVPDIELVVSVSPELLRQKLLGKLERKLDKQLEKAAIRSIAEILVTSCGFKFRRSAFRGEEPKLTLLAPGGDAEAVPLDLAVNAETPLYAAALLSECAQWDLRAKQLILLVRRWAKDRGICHAAKGYLSPYHWSLLVIYFLQVCPRVLPPLTAFMAFQQLSSKGSASSPDDAPRPEPNPVHTSKLFKDFMHFYQDFDWRNEMINPISGSPGKSTFEDSSSPLILQDPFRPLNLGRRISTSSFARTQEEFARAGAICAEGVAVGRIFELWVPPTGDAEED
ncbi:unnamed protein product [Durusdinium trenchii]|uniref:Uncharacterized protein n=1 Tax=Durusdinium trenchii TaxID=1381693 RepID=A0ABP0MPW1_9DINO